MLICSRTSGSARPTPLVTEDPVMDSVCKSGRGTSPKHYAKCREMLVDMHQGVFGLTMLRKLQGISSGVLNHRAGDYARVTTTPVHRVEVRASQRSLNNSFGMLALSFLTQ